jgi:hypothetical protein
MDVNYGISEVCPRVGNQNAAIIPRTVITATTTDFAISFPVIIATHKMRDVMLIKAIVTQNPFPNLLKFIIFYHPLRLLLVVC